MTNSAKTTDAILSAVADMRADLQAKFGGAAMTALQIARIRRELGLSAPLAMLLATLIYGEGRE